MLGAAAYISRLSQYFELHPQNPQPRLIRQAAQILRDGGVIAYPTDSCYALGCHIGDKAAADRFETIHTPEGETVDNICVWMPDDRVVFTTPREKLPTTTP